MQVHTVRRSQRVKLRRVEGDLHVGKNAVVEADTGRRLIVTGGVIFDGGATIDASLECDSVQVRAAQHTGGTVVITGDLKVSREADVADSLEVKGTAAADGFDVGGHITAGSLIARRVRTGGHLKVRGSLESESVDVAGHMSVLGRIEIVNLHVGGHAEITAGSITGTAEVRGHFKSSLSLEYGEIHGYGHVNLPAKSRGKKVSVLGRVTFGRDSFCGSIEVRGTAETEGDCAADEVQVLGKFNVSGSLKVQKELKVTGSAEASGDVRCGRLSVEGRLAAMKIFATEEADLSGDLKTVAGLRSKAIAVRRGARVKGPLAGEHVDVGEKPDFGFWPSMWSGPWPKVGQMTLVEDMYASTVRVGPYSRAKRIFAESVEMGNGSIADEVKYTTDLKLDPKCYIHHPPQKVAKLPEPPL